MTSEHCNQEYSRDDIEIILGKIKECVARGKYIISLNKNRKENQDFIAEYNIHSKKQKEILLNLKLEDFCYSVQNTNPGYEHEILHIFCPQVKLYSILDEEEIVDIYIKFNLLESFKGNRTIVISFHRGNKPITYLYR